MRKKVFIIISIMAFTGMLTACGHKHTFSEATCTSAKTCIDCGETEGDPLGHTWLEANCEKPETCSVCGATEGEAKGHSVDVGVCSTCNKVANEELIYEVFDYFDKATEASDAAVESVNSSDVSSLSNTYDHIVIADSNLSNVKINMQSLCELCGDYDSLKEIKSAAKAVLDDIPSNISSSDKDNIVSWLNDFEDYLNTYRSALSTLSECASTLVDAD